MKKTNSKSSLPAVAFVAFMQILINGWNCCGVHYYLQYNLMLADLHLYYSQGFAKLEIR